MQFLLIVCPQSFFKEQQGKGSDMLDKHWLNPVEECLQNNHVIKRSTFSTFIYAWSAEWQPDWELHEQSNILISNIYIIMITQPKS